MSNDAQPKYLLTSGLANPFKPGTEGHRFFAMDAAALDAGVAAWFGVTKVEPEQDILRDRMRAAVTAVMNCSGTATQPAITQRPQGMGIVRVCPDCDIAECEHLRAASHRPSDSERLEFLLPVVTGDGGDEGERRTALLMAAVIEATLTGPTKTGRDVIDIAMSKLVEEKAHA